MVAVIRWERRHGKGDQFPASTGPFVQNFIKSISEYFGCTVEPFCSFHGDFPPDSGVY